ncbi:hypothetical protein F2Q69_00022339 [Brassica cretica]|uniref:Uncharacterized protein n=1 Tax=Brassica cretica TaxID=69181 RepID=A0A8S9QJ92_BRACR|nr:hypothetical protein F2Q69_00022339 [Brassica cretica]
MGVEKYSGLIDGQKFTGKTEIRPNEPKSSSSMQLDTQKHEMSPYLQPQHADRHVGTVCPRACDPDMLMDIWSSRQDKSSVQSTILYDCDVEALSNSIHPNQSYSPTIKWRCRPKLVQIHIFRSVEVLLDTPPGSPKNCPEAKRGYVRVQISQSRPVSVFMMKPRYVQVEISLVQSRRSSWVLVMSSPINQLLLA